MYEIVKITHMSAVSLSVLLFLFRFILTLMKSDKLQQKWLKILPHIVDTVLIVAAITLCILIKQYPIVDAWVTEKLMALIMYVFMVALALKSQQTWLMRGVGLVGALSWVAYAGFVAVTKQPLIF
ncbi:SirB2 family protein [Paraglaciecola sp. 2405UD69-4]|uniref:SirB2 family protein n=1 Tax=Paraglaciecola sp. 2405UD69-4 TaxID=3391836 RepID=UPI0039C9E63B